MLCSATIPVGAAMPRRTEQQKVLEAFFCSSSGSRTLKFQSPQPIQVNLCQKSSNATTTRMDDFCPLRKAGGSNLSIPTDSQSTIPGNSLHLQG